MQEDIHARLVRAQRAENVAVRRLGEFGLGQGFDKSGFANAMSEARVARERSVAVYREWQLLVEAHDGQDPAPAAAVRDRATRRDAD